MLLRRYHKDTVQEKPAEQEVKPVEQEQPTEKPKRRSRKATEE